ncbi:MAG: chromosomal replication initiator protein DnaA [Thermodesulfobacteriota bacterium]
MQKEKNRQIWQAFIGHLEASDKVDPEIVELLSKSQISKLDEKNSFLEVVPPDEIGFRYLMNNLGNSLGETREYFKNFHGINHVEVINPSGGNGEYYFTSSEKNERREVFLGHLNSKYTFENFVVGESNNFANAAALGSVRSPGGENNPLFIRGPSGLGKTHLMNAIGNEFAKRNPKMNICCLSSEEFTNIVVDHISKRNTNFLRQKLRKQCDLLMVDDVQFLEGRKSTLDEFFHTFNTLHEAGKQIVLTSDKVPTEMENLEERITSRFMWGIVVDIRPPDIDTRVAIIRKKAEERNVQIPSGVVEMISSKVKNNVRELEGALTKLVVFSEAENKPIDITTANELFSGGEVDRRSSILAVPNGMNTKFIKGTVEEFFSLKPGQIESPERSRSIAFPRQIAMFLIKKHMVEMPYASIGEEFGNRDHSTVMHAVSKIGKEVEAGEETTITAIKEIEDMLRV